MARASSGKEEQLTPRMMNEFVTCLSTVLDCNSRQSASTTATSVWIHPEGTTMSKPPADFRTLVRLTSFAHMVQQGPAAPKTDATWNEEKECLILLLKARMMLRDIVEGRLKQERLLLGNLSVAEIQNILKNQTEDGDTDWIAEIQELKRNMVAELRKNHQLERELSKLDKRIALLIKHRSNIKEIIAAAQKKTKAAKREGDTQFHLTPKQLEGYQNLFYLLQTEPHYLGKLVTLVQPDKMEQFLDTVILTLFGDAFSPREEFLILSLFNLAITQETKANSNVAELISMESVVPKMIITYNRRKQGHEYLKQIITPILESVTNIVDLNLELSVVQIYQALITDIEIQTGQKSTLNRELPEDKIADLPEVKTILAARVEKCISICNMFFDGIINSLSRLPYGIRWICKQIHSIAKQKWDTSDDDIGKVIGYFVYYRFMNVAIVTPDSHALTGKEVSMLARRNLVVVAKVLQTLFSLNQFQKQGNERWLLPLNEWISSKMGLVRKYFSDLITITDPSEYLRVDKYNELTLKISPVIIISLSEMFQTHLLILDNLSSLVKDKNDPLEVIMKELVAPPAIVGSDELEKEIQLTLVNKFKERMEEDISSSAMVLAATKELVIHVFRGMPQQPNVHEHKKGKQADAAPPTDDLIAILNSAQQYGKENNQAALTSNVTKILANLKQLQANGAIAGSGDNYQSFLRAIALEVANRQAVREQQQKERTRLFLALKEIRKYGDYLNDQIAQYHDYLKTVLGHYGPRDPSKRSKPIKFSYKELAKKGVIVASEVPKIGQKSTAFFLSTDTPGVFDIEAKMGGKTVDTIQLELDELLDRSHSNVSTLKLENVTLDVNLTLHLLNRYFLRKVK